MDPSKVLITLRKTYCGICFDSFENFSLQLQDFMSTYSLKTLSLPLPEPPSGHSGPSPTSALKELLNSILSSQIPSKRIVFCRDCGQTIHWACLPNKSYKQPLDHVFLEGVTPVKTFLCCVCHWKSSHQGPLKDTKSKPIGACMECSRAEGLRVALQGKKRDVLLGQFVHPVCALFSSVVAPKNLREFSFLRRVEKFSSTSADMYRICFFCHKRLRSSFANCGQSKCNRQAHIYCFLHERTNFAVKNDLDLNDGILWQFYYSKSIKNNDVFKSPYYRNFDELKGSCYHQLAIDNTLNNQFGLDRQIMATNTDKQIAFAKQPPSGKNMFKIRCDAHKIDKENCFCGKPQQDTSYVQCECCSQWFHETCLVALGIGYTPQATFYCCKCKFIYLENELDRGALEGLDKLSSITARYHLKFLDRLIILQTLEKLVREKRNLPFVRIVENFNQINCFNASIQALEKCVKLQILDTLHSVLQAKLETLSDLSELHNYIFVYAERGPVGPETSTNLEIEPSAPENPERDAQESAKNASGNNSRSLRTQNLLDLLGLRIDELDTLLNQFRKIDAQCLGKEAPTYLRADVTGLEWLCEFFRKICELIEAGPTQSVSFSFNEVWQFLANPPSLSEPVQRKVTSFKQFFTEIVKWSLRILEEPSSQEISVCDENLISELTERASQNELILACLPLFLRHMQVDFASEDLARLTERTPNESISLEGFGEGFRTGHLLHLIRSKNKEEISRFGGHFEEKDFKLIRRFLGQCAGLELCLEKGQAAFRARQKMFDRDVSKHFPSLELVSAFLQEHSQFVDNFKISREIESKQKKSLLVNQQLALIMLDTLRQIESIQESIFKSKQRYNDAFAVYSAQKVKSQKMAESDVTCEQPPKCEHPQPDTPLKKEAEVDVAVNSQAPLPRPTRPTINSNPFHPNNFDCTARKLELRAVVHDFAKEGLFVEKGLYELADFLNDYFMLNNFLYDLSQESLRHLFEALELLSGKLNSALETLSEQDIQAQLKTKAKDIFKPDKCDQIVRMTRKKLNIVGSKISRILDKTTSANWETSIDTVKEILTESDYISKIKVSDFSESLERCLQIRSVCKILRKIDNKRALEVKALDDARQKIIDMVEGGSMQVEFNSDNSLNQAKREHLGTVLGNAQITDLLAGVLETIDKQHLSSGSPSIDRIESISELEARRKLEKLERLRAIGVTDLDTIDFRLKIAMAVAGEFKTRKLPFINFDLLGNNPEARMVRSVVKAYFQRKNHALENKAHNKVNLFLYLDYKNEAKQYSNGSGEPVVPRPKPIPVVENIFSAAADLGRDQTVEYFLFNTFSKVRDVMSTELKSALIGKRGHFMENHEILSVMFSDEYQELAFREKDYLRSLEYVFKKVADLDLSEVVYSEPSRQAQVGRKESDVSRKSERALLDCEWPPLPTVQTVDGVLVLPHSKYCSPELCASKRPSDIIKRISEKVQRLNEMLENLHIMTLLHEVEAGVSGFKYSVREADLKKIKDFVRSYSFCEDNHILQFACKQTEQLMKTHNNLRYLINTVNMHSVDTQTDTVRLSKGSHNRMIGLDDFLKKVDAGRLNWINLWSLDAGKKQYDKCLRRFVRVKEFKHLFPDKIQLIKVHLRGHKDLRNDVRQFTLSLKLETQKSPMLYKRVAQKYWEFRERFIKTPFYSDELHAVMCQFELVYLLFSLYNEPVSLRNLVGFEHLLRETGYDKLKISACGMFMDREVEKLSQQLKKIERCLSIAQSGVFFGSQLADFDKLDFQSCGIELRDSMDLESYLQNESRLTEVEFAASRLPTCRLVFLVTRVSSISILVKNALRFHKNSIKKHHVEEYSGLLFTIFSRLNLGADPMFRKLFGPEYKEDVYEQLTLQGELRKKLDLPIQTWKALNILANRVANNFYSKSFSQSSLDRFLIEQQVNSVWFHSEFYKSTVEKFLRMHSLVFLIKRAVLSKLFLQLVQCKQAGSESTVSKEEFIPVFDEDCDSFCRQDVLKTIYIFTDLKNRHWHPRSSRKSASSLKTQFDKKWNLEEGLRYDLVVQYLDLFRPVAYARPDPPTDRPEPGSKKVRDYLGQIQHKYVKYPNLKLMFQKLARRGDCFEDDKIVSVLLMVLSIMVDLCFYMNQQSVSFVDVSFILKEGHMLFHRLKNKQNPEIKELFESSSEEASKKNTEKSGSPKSKTVDGESGLTGKPSESKAQSVMDKIKDRMKESLKRVNQADLHEKSPKSCLSIGLRTVACFLEKLRRSYNLIRDQIKSQIVTGKSGSEPRRVPRKDDVESIFNSHKLSTKIKASDTLSSIESKIKNIKTKHNISTEKKSEEPVETDPKMAVKGVISWQKLFPRLENYSFSAVHDSSQDRPVSTQITHMLKSPQTLFEVVTQMVLFFNTEREKQYNRDRKTLRKILSKIKVSGRGLLSKEIEKDHAKMLYQTNQSAATTTSGNLRLTNLVKSTGPQNSYEMKKYVMAIVRGEGGSDYEENSKLDGIFRAENLNSSVPLDKETEAWVEQLRQRRLSLSDIAKMSFQKMPVQELRKYEQWRLEQENLAQELEQRLVSNKHLESDFVESKLVTPAISCLVRKMRNSSIRYRPGWVLKLEFALAKQKKLGKLLTRLMDEEVAFEDLRKKFERHYHKFKKRQTSQGKPSHKKKQARPTPPKAKDSLLDDIFQDIVLTGERERAEPVPDRPEQVPVSSSDQSAGSGIGDILKLNIFQISKLGLLDESAHPPQSLSAKCNYYFTGDPRVLELFQNIKGYPRLRRKINKKMTSLIRSLIDNPLYPSWESNPGRLGPSHIYGLTENKFRQNFTASSEYMISGWCTLKDPSLLQVLNRMLDRGKALGCVFSADFVFYLNRPQLEGPSEEVATRLWNHWGLRPIPNYSADSVQFRPVDFDQLFVFCIKRKVGINKAQKDLPESQIRQLKSEMVDQILQKAEPATDPFQVDTVPIRKNSLYSYFREIKSQDTKLAFETLVESVKSFQERPPLQPQIDFVVPAVKKPPLPLNFLPAPEYLGKRNNNLLDAVQEIPTGNIFEGLVGRPQHSQPMATHAQGPESREDVAVKSPNRVGFAEPVESVPAEQQKSPGKNQSGDENEMDNSHLLEIVKNVSSADLKDIYKNLTDSEMKQMLYKAVQQYYPPENNPLM